MDPAALKVQVSILITFFFLKKKKKKKKRRRRKMSKIINSLKHLSETVLH